MTHVKVHPSELVPGREAFSALAGLPTGRLAYKIARNASEFRRADRLFQAEAKRILHLFAWMHDGELVYGCADRRFDPSKYVGEHDDGFQLEAGSIYSRDGRYHLIQDDAQEVLGDILISINGQGNVCMKNTVAYRKEIEALEETEIEMQLTLIDPEALSEIEGISAQCFWPPMLDE